VRPSGAWAPWPQLAPPALSVAAGGALRARLYETPSAVAALLSLGVTCGQGFHIGRPRPLEAALDAAAEA
jgi:hypothetical protein